MVSSHSALTFGVLKLVITVQSSSKAPDYLDSRVEAFLVSFRRHLDEMSENEFEGYRAAVVALKQERVKTIYEEAAERWTPIHQRHFVFSRDEEVKTLLSLCKADILAFFDAHIRINTFQRAKFSVQIESQNKSSSDAEKAPENDNNVTQAWEAALEPAPVDHAILVRLSRAEVANFKGMQLLYPNPYLRNLPRVSALL